MHVYPTLVISRLEMCSIYRCTLCRKRTGKKFSFGLHFRTIYSMKKMESLANQTTDISILVTFGVRGFGLIRCDLEGMDHTSRYVRRRIESVGVRNIIFPRFKKRGIAWICGKCAGPRFDYGQTIYFPGLHACSSQ
jgi:hypothetical protein